MPPILKTSIRFLEAVAALGEKSPYNNLTWFEAPVSKMPNAELGEQALKLWEELNHAGRDLRQIIENDEIDTIASLLEKYKDKDYALIHSIVDDGKIKKGFVFALRNSENEPDLFFGDTAVQAIKAIKL